MIFTFYLGCPNPAWLSKHPGVPLFVSRRQMPKKKFQRAITDWALDSGGFTELQKYGRWTIDSFQYACLVNEYHEKVGRLRWAAQQDWMCEPVVINGGVAGGQKFVGTKLSVREHQQLTVENFLELDGVCKVPVVPVIQGFTKDEYHECIDLYAKNGVDLSKRPVVGVGSICRRQATDEAAGILRSIADRGIPIHGFGLKREALKKVVHILRSADSMAWSFNARRAGTSCGRINHKTGKPIKNCANCYHAALEWYEKTMLLVERDRAA